MAIKVLLVDDSSSVARQLEKALQPATDFEIVAHAKTGAEALRLYSVHAPDLVLMDIVMPEMDGIQALRTLRTMDKDARVVMVSSLGGSEQKASELLSLGARAVITKPFLTDELMKAVRDAIADRQT